jgi:hypothetical protein
MQHSIAHGAQRPCTAKRTQVFSVSR